ncbi:MAG TPA: cytochrome P450, partial [Desulfitobacterium dehalogenans]|nr:cytochrome P450 [Desulfitobacterium dehalogenans]
ITEKCLQSLGDCFPVFAIEKLSFEELKEARDVIQIMGSQLAAQRRTEEDLARIYSAISSAQDMHTCDFSGKLVNFQVELVKASYNKFLLANITSIARTLRMVFLKLNLTDDIKKEYIDNMENIYESLTRQDHLKVATDMRMCLNYCNGVIHEVLR